MATHAARKHGNQDRNIGTHHSEMQGDNETKQWDRAVQSQWVKWVKYDNGIERKYNVVLSCFGPVYGLTLGYVMVWLHSEQNFRVNHPLRSFQIKHEILRTHRGHVLAHGVEKRMHHYGTVVVQRLWSQCQPTDQWSCLDQLRLFLPIGNGGG